MTFAIRTMRSPGAQKSRAKTRGILLGVMAMMAPVDMEKIPFFHTGFIDNWWLFGISSINM